MKHSFGDYECDGAVGGCTGKGLFQKNIAGFRMIFSGGLKILFYIVFGSFVKLKAPGGISKNQAVLAGPVPEENPGDGFVF